MLELSLQRNGKKLLRQSITPDPLTIGRAQDNTLRLLDPEISRHHCRLEWRDNSLFAVDLSSNGLLINGKIQKESAIDVGDRMTIGPWLALLESAIDAVPIKTIAASPNATRVLSFNAAKRRLSTERIEILVNSPDQGPTKKRIAKSEVTIGHHASSDVAVADPYVSRRHCKLVVSSGQTRLFDLGSTNGTYVSDARITQIAMPMQGKFRIGRSLVNYRVVTEVEEIEPSKSTKLGSMVGTSRQMREIFALIERVAPSNTTILIMGESGTGKELVARELHLQSLRSKNSFIAANCAAIPANLIESQLFGHERGAFTGAMERMTGLFEQAKDGTLFLDEIGEMPIDLQSRLLRVLEDKSIKRVGGQEEIPVDFRLICATNRDLETLVKQGKFREDLLFRIFVVPIIVPPLKNRPEDIRLLAKHFAKELAAEGRTIVFSDESIARLVKHQWPGNVRELKNVIERTLLFTNHDLIEKNDLLLTNFDLRDEEKNNLKDQERSYIVEALKSCRGNLSHTADKLGIARTTLQMKVKKHKIEVHRER